MVNLLRRRGATLATTSMVILLLLCIGLTLLGVGIHNLSFAHRVENHERARQLAE